MEDSIRKFAIKLFILMVVLMATGYGLFYLVIPYAWFKVFPLVPLFVFIVTLLVHVYLIKASKNDAKIFARKYLGSMGIKILTYIVFIVVVLALDTGNAVPFLISFLVCYATFTLLEVIEILKIQKSS